MQGTIRKSDLECGWNVQKRSSKGTTTTARETWRARCEDGCFVETQTLTADLMNQVLSQSRKNHVRGSTECAQVWCNVYLHKDEEPHESLGRFSLQLFSTVGEDSSMMWQRCGKDVGNVGEPRVLRENMWWSCESRPSRVRIHVRDMRGRKQIACRRGGKLRGDRRLSWCALPFVGQFFLTSLYL